jgi:hypothetical protein
MPGLLLMVFLGLSLFSCASSPEREPPLQNAPVFLGVAGGFYLSKDRAVNTALRDAARRVSLYHAVEAVIQIDEVYNLRYRITGVHNKRELIYDEEYEKYIESLEFDPEKDVYEEHDAVFVRARYQGRGTDRVNYMHPASSGQEKPGWIENPPPEINGYPAAAGFAGGRLSHRDTVVASYEDAIFALVQNNFSTVEAAQETYGDVTAYSSASRVRGKVKGFYILETWTDPQSKAVWTLALAREVSESTTSP